MKEQEEQMLSRYTKAINKGTEFFKKSLISKKQAVSYVGGFLGQQNLGDEALYAATKLLFNKFDFLHYDASRTLTLLFKRFSFIRTGILAGGTLINRIPEWYQIAEKFYELCPNLYVFGTGVANPTFWSGCRTYVDMMDKWKPFLEKCQYVGVRGPMSAELLSDAGIKDVEVVGDPVLAFAESQISGSYSPNSIGLNIGQATGNMWGDETTTCSEFIKIANLAREAEWVVKWFVVWPNDLEITQKAAYASNTAGYIYRIYNDPQMYIKLVKSLSTFVGMKLHATILATCAYVPSIMLEYRPKCRDYMKSIGQDASTIKTDEFRAEHVWEIVSFWNSQRHEKAETLFRSIKILQEKQRLKAEELMNKMDLRL